MIAPVELKRTKLDIGIRVVGVAAGYGIALFMLVLGMGPTGHFLIGFTISLIALTLSVWGTIRTVQFSREGVEISEAGFTFRDNGRVVPWSEVAQIVSTPSRHALVLLDRDGDELGLIYFSFLGFEDVLVHLMREAGKRSQAPFDGGRMVIERKRSRGVLIGSTLMLILPAYGLFAFSRSSGLIFLLIIIVGAAISIYRRGGVRRLELDLAYIRWRNREEGGEFAWSELALIGLWAQGQEYVSGPSLVLVSRKAMVVQLPLDDFDIGAVASFIRVGAPKLWDEAFLHGLPLTKRVKEIVAERAKDDPSLEEL